MTKLRGARNPLVKGVKEVADGVRDTGALAKHDSKSRIKRRVPPTHTAKNEEQPEKVAGRKATKFETIKVHGSKGEEYTVTVPASIMRSIPKHWEWTDERYRVAELIASGIPFSQIPDDPAVSITARITIYGWLEHPEFKQHVDALVLETGWANRRERLNNLKKLNDLVFNKVARGIEGMKLTDKNVGALLGAIQAGSKLIAQEKGELVEETKVTSEVSMTGKVTNVNLDVENYMSSLPSEERQELEKEFDQLGDDIIRTITGQKE